VKQLKYDKWLEIDIDAVKQNLEGVKSLLDSSVHLLAVLRPMLMVMGQLIWLVSFIRMGSTSLR